MTWFTWRQHRSNAAFAGAMLLVLGVAVIYLSIAGAGLLAEVRSCTPAQGACGAMQAWFNSNLQTWWGPVSYTHLQLDRHALGVDLAA